MGGPGSGRKPGGGKTGKTDFSKTPKNARVSQDRLVRKDLKRGGQSRTRAIVAQKAKDHGISKFIFQKGRYGKFSSHKNAKNK